MFDLAVDDHGDLIWTASGDLAAAIGSRVYDQRVFTRLKIPRGEWIYDIRGDLGSELKLILRNARGSNAERVRTLVGEALRPAGDIDVRDVEILPNALGNRVDVIVRYVAALTEAEQGTAIENDLILQTTVSL